MKPKLYGLFLVGLFCLALLTGCLRNRTGNPGGQPAATAARPTATLQTALNNQALTATPASAGPAAVDPTQTRPAALDPTAQPTLIASPAGAAAPDVSRAADDLSKSLDDLMKDINADDGLNDVK
jgi:hypothetical protein